MQRLLKLIDAICFAGGVVACLAIAALALMLIGEVILTSAFEWSQPWAVEYSAYLLAAGLFAGSGWTLRTGGHIRVNAVVMLLPQLVQRWLDVAVTVFALGLLLYVSTAVTDNAWRSFELGSLSFYPTRTPLFYPQAMLAASFWVLTLAMLARLIRLVIGEAPDDKPPTVGAQPEKPA